jgi:hypothetical protein
VSPSRRRRLPLRGADLVLVAMQALWQRAGVSNNTVMVVQCDGPIATARITAALERFLDFAPWPAARLERPFPWGKLAWAAGPRATLTAPPVRRRDIASREALQLELEAELNRAIDPRREPPLRFVLLDHVAEAQSFLVATWFHPLMDPRGGQNLLAHLEHLDQVDTGRAPWGGTPPAFVAEPDLRPLRERGRLGRRSQRYMRTLMPGPPVSPGTGLTSPGRARFRHESFLAAERGETRVAREVFFRLAVVGRSMAELWRRRGLPDTPFLLPVSIDLRPKGEPGPTFGNLLAFHFARFRPSDTGDVSALTQALRHQMVDALRDGQIDANAVAMQFLAYRPLAVMLRDLPGTAGRETFSFNCADLGDVPPALDKLFGRRVVNVYHAPTVLPRPGVGVFFNRCGMRNNLVVSWIEGAVSEDEVTRIVEAVREGMGWRRAS